MITGIVTAAQYFTTGEIFSWGAMVVFTLVDAFIIANYFSRKSLTR